MRARSIIGSRGTRIVAALTLALGVGLGGLAASTEAATPTQATISDTTTTTSWTGGPFVAPNPTGAAGAPDCTAPGSCDDFALHVRTPAGYGGTHRLKIQVGWTNTAADFDVYLLDQAGKTVATAASSADPETVLTAPTSGDYTVRVVPYAPLGAELHRQGHAGVRPCGPRPGHRAPPGLRQLPGPRVVHGRQQRRRALDRHQLPQRRHDVPGLPVHLQGHLRRLRVPGARDLERRLGQRRERLPGGQHQVA